MKAIIFTIIFIILIFLSYGWMSKPWTGGPEGQQFRIYCWNCIFNHPELPPMAEFNKDIRENFKKKVSYLIPIEDIETNTFKRITHRYKCKTCDR